MRNMLICCTFTTFTMVVPLLLLKNTVDGFLCTDILIVSSFPRSSIHGVNVVRSALIMFHLNGHVNSMWRNRKTFLVWYSVALLLARTDLLHVWVFHKHVYGLHCMKTDCTHFTHCMCKIYAQGTVYTFRILSLVTYKSLISSVSTIHWWSYCQRNGINNTCNSYRWSHDNPHATLEQKFQRLFSINVWCGMMGDMLIGPVILDELVTGKNYLHFLQNGLSEQLENVRLATRSAMYFQHDRATFHYTHLVMQHHNGTSANRGIGHGSTINWPPRSPDLTPLDFCLWGWMKNEVYRRKVDTRDELLDLIMDVIASI